MTTCFFGGIVTGSFLEMIESIICWVVLDPKPLGVVLSKPFSV